MSDLGQTNKIDRHCVETASALGCAVDRVTEQTPLVLLYHDKFVFPEIKSAFALKSDAGAAIALAAYREAIDRNRVISYSRDKTHYAILPERYRGTLYTYTNVVRTVDQLDAAGLIRHDRASPGRLGWRSGFVATPALVERVDRLVHGQTPALAMRQPTEPVVLRDHNGRVIDYRDTRYTRSRRNNVIALNERILNTEITNTAGDDLRAPLISIHNERWSRNGRLSAVGGQNWQNLKIRDENGVERWPRPAQVLIDGEPTEEVDYKSLHPMLLYASLNLQPPYEPYDIGWSEEYRDLIKTAFNIAINASSLQSAISAIAVAEPIKTFERPASRDARRLAAALVDDIKRVHAPVANYFHSGYGATLMNIDAKMTIRIMKEMHQKGDAVLPVHDSYLIRASEVGQLEQAMQAAAEQEGFTPILERKYEKHRRDRKESIDQSKPAPGRFAKPDDNRGRNHYRGSRPAATRRVPHPDEYITTEWAIWERGLDRDQNGGDRDETQETPTARAFVEAPYIVIDNENGNPHFETVQRICKAAGGWFDKKKQRWIFGWPKHDDAISVIRYLGPNAITIESDFVEKLDAVEDPEVQELRHKRYKRRKRSPDAIYKKYMENKRWCKHVKKQASKELKREGYDVGDRSPVEFIEENGLSPASYSYMFGIIARRKCLRQVKVTRVWSYGLVILPKNARLYDDSEFPDFRTEKGRLAFLRGVPEPSRRSRKPRKRRR